MWIEVVLKKISCQGEAIADFSQPCDRRPIHGPIRCLDPVEHKPSQAAVENGRRTKSMNLFSPQPLPEAKE